MSEEQGDISADRLFFLDEQRVIVEDFDAEGFILDVGGGGEGIIGRLKGSQVVAIDPDRGELEEAPVGPLKIVMDARDLKFLDGTFELVTSFFTLMYIDRSDHQRVFDEVRRVLGPGGRFVIWDVSIPERVDGEQDVLVVPLTVSLPSTEVETGYGVVWPEEPFGLPDYVELAEQTGFDVVEARDDGSVFYLALRRS